jgi:hypothetical protein
MMKAEDSGKYLKHNVQKPVILFSRLAVRVDKPNFVRYTSHARVASKSCGMRFTETPREDDLMAQCGILRDYRFTNAAEDIRGSKVYGLNDEKLGKIDDVIFDHASGSIRYVVVDTGTKTTLPSIWTKLRWRPFRLTTKRTWNRISNGRTMKENIGRSGKPSQ